MNHTHRIIGIDVGRDALNIAFPPTEPNTPLHRTPTLKIDMTAPDWWQRLLSIIDERAIIAAEPTGVHLLMPIARLLELHRPHAQLWTILHTTAEHYRTLRIAGAKNDRIDSIAILQAAIDIAAGQPPRGAKPFDPARADHLFTLRLKVNAHFRLTKEVRRAKQRINILVNALAPGLADSDTYHRAAAAGFITPSEIIALVEALDAGYTHPTYKHGSARHPLRKLAARLPPTAEPSPALRDEIAYQFRQLAQVEAERAALVEAIEAIITSPPLDTVTRRWRTIPASNAVALAALFVAVDGDPINTTVDGFKAAVGTNPLTRTSGNGDQTRSSRKGYKPARAALFMWTYALLSPHQPENPVRQYYAEREGRTIFAARTKLARVLWGRARDSSLDDVQSAQKGSGDDEQQADRERSNQPG